MTVIIPSDRTNHYWLERNTHFDHWNYPRVQNVYPRRTKQLLLFAGISSASAKFYIIHYALAWRAQLNSLPAIDDLFLHHEQNNFSSPLTRGE
jgi:hypothetical protein